MDEARKDALARAAKHWDARPGGRVERRSTRWWQSPAVIRHLNKKLCGEPLNGFAKGLRVWLASEIGETRLKTAVSVGCGNGGKELQFLQEDLVETFDLYEISSSRVAHGQKLAEEAGLSDRMRFTIGDAFEDQTPARYDLVYWDNALHHMFDVEEAIAWSMNVLKPGGWLVVHDYIGAVRFQFSAASLDYARRMREALPPEYLENGESPGAFLSPEVDPVDKDWLIAHDPTEAADSKRIPEVVSRAIPAGEWRMLGGAIYHTGLNNLYWNFERYDDGSRLQSCLVMDDLLSDMGDNQYAAFIGQKPG